MYIPETVAEMLNIVCRYEQWDDTAERLAVRLIRKIKEENDMLNEWDRATRVIARRMFGIGGSCVVRERIALERLQDEQQTFRAPGIAFFHSRPVNVNGSRLKLKWCV